MEQLSKEEKAVLREVAKNNKDIAIPTSFLETEDYILEQVYNATPATLATYATGIYYLRFDKQSASIKEIDRFVYKDREYKPIEDELLRSGTILLPSKIEEYGTTEKLIKEISDFLFSYFEVPKFFEYFLPYVVLFYWVYEKFPFVPYLHFIGLTGTGKTTAQEVLGSVCYKPIDASGAITLSPIFRTANTWRGTLLLDEFEPDGENYREMMALLKSGVSNKAILRTEGDTKREVKVYLIKSPKVFTSEKPINNAGLQSRTIVIQMQKNKIKVPLFRLPHFLEESQSLRNKLLLWRFHNLNKIDLKEIEYGFEELQVFDRRVQQVITPIYYLSGEKAKKEIVKFAKVQQEETMKERRDSLEGQIFQAIIENYPKNIPIKLITDAINQERSSRRPLTGRTISNLIRKVFNFNIERIGHENTTVVILDKQENKVKELCEYFGMSIPVASVAGVASVANSEKGDTDALKNATDEIKWL